jgi:thiol-disulfide isomerase/thioredoxin
MTPGRRRVLGAAGATAVLAGVGTALWRETHPAADESFWALRFPSPAGPELVLATLRGRPLLLNFWATWCPPCVREFPLLDRFQRAQAPAGWQVVGLAVDGPTPVREFLLRNPVSFAIGLAGLNGTQMTRSLGNSSGALPFTAVFDRRGMLRRQHLGELDEAVLKAWVESL